MFYFCTYFDQHYLPRALALHASLRSCGTEFRLWALCLDTPAFETLQRMGLPGVEPVALSDVERGDPALLAVKENRSRAEYYFTCTPALPLYVLERWPEVDLITYLDADLFFYSHPGPLFEEMSDGSVGIIGHRFSPANRSRERFGTYNVGWVSFRRDADGMSCLTWWRERCLEWCYDRVEEERYADQKYLNVWPQRFGRVKVLAHKGADLAPWNITNFRIRELDGGVRVDDEPLIFFHFQGFQQITPWLYNSNFGLYHAQPSSTVRRQVIGPYIRALREVTHAAAVPRGIRRADHRYGWLVRWARRLARVLFGLVHREYVLIVNGRVL